MEHRQLILKRSTLGGGLNLAEKTKHEAELRIRELHKVIEECKENFENIYKHKTDKKGDKIDNDLFQDELF